MGADLEGAEAACWGRHGAAPTFDLSIAPDAAGGVVAGSDGNKFLTRRPAADAVIVQLTPALGFAPRTQPAGVIFACADGDEPAPGDVACPRWLLPQQTTELSVFNPQV